jgi:hypothetical protein
MWSVDGDSSLLPPSPPPGAAAAAETAPALSVAELPAWSGFAECGQGLYLQDFVIYQAWENFKIDYFCIYPPSRSSHLKRSFKKQELSTLEAVLWKIKKCTKLLYKQ